MDQTTLSSFQKSISRLLEVLKYKFLSRYSALRKNIVFLIEIEITTPNANFVLIVRPRNNFSKIFHSHITVDMLSKKCAKFGYVAAKNK